MDIGHLHLSSRYDRDGDTLRTQLGDWMGDYQLITLTQVNSGDITWLRDLGWDYQSLGDDLTRADVLVAWSKTAMLKQWGQAILLTYPVAYTMNAQLSVPLYVVTVGLKVAGNYHLLVTCTYFPPYMEGRGYKTINDAWAARKISWSTALQSWSRHIKAAQRPDWSVLATADFNVDLKQHWVRDQIASSWDLRPAWTSLPGTGGNLAGGSQAPPGAPGKGSGDRIYDGTYYDGLRPVQQPVQLPRTGVDQHRPYVESWQLLEPGEVMDEMPVEDGDISHSADWWGYGDHTDDELYDRYDVTL